MAMARVLHLWNEWEIQILVLVSFALQVFLLSFAWMRRHGIPRVLRILLWLMYLLAEYTATYTLGHMSIGGKGGEHQQLMAFWAPFLLVHLGGQDTITAYAMEDSLLWLRHLLTFAVQALGATYVLYKYIGSRGPLVIPAVLMFTVGLLKNAERVWALSFSRLEIIRSYLDGVSIKQDFSVYPGPDCLLPQKIHQLTQATPSNDHRQPNSDAWDFWLSLERLLARKPMKREPEPEQSELDDESVLQGAHDLLYICLGQFVDDKIWPSEFQRKAMVYFHNNHKTFQMVEMQLSLMYDIFYTKAAVIHTWYGRCFRAISLLGISMAFFLFQFSNGKSGYNRVDATVTYILIAGAFILEAASVLRAMGSTWTCAMLRERQSGWLHSLHVSFRRYVRISQARRWCDSIGQLNLLDSYSYPSDKTSTAAETGADEEESDETSADRESIGEILETRADEGSRVPREKVQEKDKRGRLRCNIFSFLRDGRDKIPTGAKELVLQEIQRMVEACGRDEGLMRSYRGQCALKQLGGFSLEHAITGTDFDQSILAWHLATHKFLMHSRSAYDQGPSLPIFEAIKAVSNYMMFLLVECPSMLPSPVRPTLHLQARKVLRERRYWRRFITRDRTIKVVEVIDPGAKLGDELIRMEESETPGPSKLLEVVFGVWVEMLCYAAHHCSRESHARQLNNGGEFMTSVWLLTTAEFSRVYYDLRNFRERKHGSIWNLMNFVDFTDFVKCWSAMMSWFSSDSMELILVSCWYALMSLLAPVLRSCWSELMSWYSSMLESAFMECILISCSVIISIVFLPIRGIIFLLKSPWIPVVPGNMVIC